MSIPLGVISFPSYGESLRRHASSSNYSRAALIDNMTRRKFSTKANHLSRAFYIPFHNSNCTHLPLYNVSKTYDAWVGDAPLGGCEFKTKLCLMQKPTQSSVDADVGFLVDVEHGTARASVRERKMGDGAEASITLPRGFDEEFSLESMTSAVQYSVAATYPLPERHVRNEVIRYPYFGITSPDEKHSLEWQVQPDIVGKLGYVLVDTTLSSAEPSILAIYHHAGIEPELPTKYTEGVLLLSEKQSRVDDAVIVASLFGLLWRIRASGKGAGTKKGRMERFGEVFQKYAQGMTKLQTE